MVNPRNLLEGIDFYNDSFVDSVRWDPRQQFMYVEPDAVGIEGIRRWVGVAAPYAYVPGATEPVPDRANVVHSVTDFADMPTSHQNIGHGSKGFGLRFGNIKEVAQSGSDLPKGSGFGVYTVDIPTAPGHLLDRRDTQGSSARQVARFAFQSTLAKAINVVGGEGDKFVIDAVHRSYGDADAVHMNVPPKGRLDMKLKGFPVPEDVIPGLLVIRNKYLPIIRESVNRP